MDKAYIYKSAPNQEINISLTIIEVTKQGYIKSHITYDISSKSRSLSRIKKLVKEPGIVIPSSAAYKAYGNTTVMVHWIEVE